MNAALAGFTVDTPNLTMDPSKMETMILKPGSLEKWEFRKNQGGFSEILGYFGDQTIDSSYLGLKCIKLRERPDEGALNTWFVMDP